ILESRPLELIKELRELSKEPSREFLKFVEQTFSNNKTDSKHNPSFQSMLLKIPFTFNSKCIKQERKDNAEVNIIQKYDFSNIVSIDIDLLREFRLYLADKDIKRKKLEKKQAQFSSLYSKFSNNNANKICWIEKLLKTPITDSRKFCLWRILIPYLRNVRKLNDMEINTILIKWLDECNNHKKLDFNPHQKIKENLRDTKEYFPISLEKLKNENKELYDLIKDLFFT
ncbi:MAG: DNA primase noncatalytic subunit PriX, partial [Nitrosopumilus sp.]|nr:DNA primase noncatalytic subunit PriX [Nitrosopumilus sp.]